MAKDRLLIDPSVSIKTHLKLRSLENDVEKDNLNDKDLLNTRQDALNITDSFYRLKKRRNPQSYQSSSIKNRLNALERVPICILDAPDLMDDYYINILDWSRHDLISVALKCSVYSYNYNTRESELLTSVSNSYVSSLKFVKEGQEVAVGNNLGCFSILDVNTKKTKGSGSISGDHRINIFACKENTSMSYGNLLMVGDKKGNISAFDMRMRMRHPNLIMNHHEGEVCGLDLSPESSLLASGGNDNLVCIWDLRKHEDPIVIRDDYMAAVKAIKWCPWRRNLLATGSGTKDRRLRILNSATNSILYEVETNSQICGAMWSPFSEEIITTHGYDTNDLQLWNYPELEHLTSISAHNSRILNSVQSPDGTMIVTSAANDSLKFWKVRKGHVKGGKSFLDLGSFYKR